MKMKYFVTVSLAVLALAGQAYAADVVRSYEPSAPIEATPVAIPESFSWDGVYVGGQIGGAWSDSGVDANASLSPPRRFYSTDASGFVGGLYAGYNFNLGGDLILGVESDFTWTSLDDSTSASNGTTTTRVDVDQKWSGAVRARAGLAMDRWLPYLAAGYAYARIDSRVSNTAPARAFQASDTLGGWTLGVGTDYAILDNVLLRAEYRYSDYGDETYRLGADSYKVDYKTNDLRVGVAYKF